MIHPDTSFLIRSLIPGTPEEAKLRGWLGQGEALLIDCMIGAAALADSAAIATSNRRDFSRFATSGLKLA